MKHLSVILLAAAVFGSLNCSGNNAKYEVSGVNAPEDGVSVFLVDRLTASSIDSAIVADGTFKMAGKAAKDAFLMVDIEGSDWSYPLFNDGTPVQINLADSTLTGSDLNVKLTECDKLNSDAYHDLSDCVEEFLALSEEERDAAEDEFTEKYETVFQKYADTKMGIIEDNMDNLIPVAFIENVPEVFGFEKFNELVSSDAPFAKHPFVLDLKRSADEANAKEKAVDDAKQAFVGKKFIDLEEADTNGKMHKLSEYVGKGNWVLVDFWASWCGPCKAEMPNVVAAYKKYHDKGFEVIGLSFDRDKEPWEKAIVEWNMPWIHLSDLKYWQSEAGRVYAVNSIPDNLLIDPDGIIVARGLRGPALEEKLAEIFK